MPSFKINFQLFLNIVTTFLFFPAFCVPLGSKSIIIYFILSVIAICILFILKPIYLLNKIYYLYKNTSFKYLLFFSIWVIFSGLLLVFAKIYSPLHYIYYMVLYLLINMLLPLFNGYLMTNKKNNLHFYIKMYVVIYSIIIFLGFFNFLGSHFNIKPILDIFKIIVNQREFFGLSTVNSYGVRVYSVFGEPGWFAGFICLNLPILYYLSKSTYRIFKNTVFNIFFKKSIVLASFINVILTLSPIWFILSIFIILWLYNGDIIHYMKKYKKFFILLFSVFLVFGLLFVNYIKNSSDGRVLRIKNTIETLSQLDYSKFALLENSLSSRITSYYNTIELWKNYPITGVGLGNSKYKLIPYFENSKLELSYENKLNLQLAYKTNKLNFNTAFVYELLSETGFIGFILYYLFLYDLYRKVKKYKYFLTGNEYFYFCGIQKSIILLFFIFAFYDVCLNNIYIWFLLGHLVAFQDIILSRSKQCQMQ